MNETQLIASNRLDKLEDLVEDVRTNASRRTYPDEQVICAIDSAAVLVALVELGSLVSSLQKEIATKHRVSQEL